MAEKQVAIVTGAANGIGEATARLFAENGYAVGMIDIADRVEHVAADIRSAGGECLFTKGDVSNEGHVRALVDQVVGAYGRIDALVNNAGIAVFKPMQETTYEEWSRVLAVNLDGPFVCTQACTPHMLKTGGGAVVNIASISGLRASTLRVAYGTSKAALLHLTRQQAVELGNLGIRVNAIAPGPVDTAMAKAVHTPAIRASYHDAIPLGRYGTPEEIAAAVGFLCGPQAAYINGQVLAVDGGFDATGIGLPALRQLQPG
jgi:NAD(P)-dependent dehydrogenase (short-subunit alcohol dehydrogenase family)